MEEFLRGTCMEIFYLLRSISICSQLRRLSADLKGANEIVKIKYKSILITARLISIEDLNSTLI